LFVIGSVLLDYSQYFIWLIALLLFFVIYGVLVD